MGRILRCEEMRPLSGGAPMLLPLCHSRASWQGQVVECQRPSGHGGRCACLDGVYAAFYVVRWPGAALASTVVEKEASDGRAGALSFAG